MQAIDIEIGEEMASELRGRTLSGLTGGTGRANAETVKALDRAVSMAVDAAEPKGAFRFTPVKEVRRASVATAFGEIASVKFSLMARLSEGDEQVLFTMSTAGEGIDRALDADAPPLSRFVLDAVGSELAELVQEAVDRKWRHEAAAAGLSATVRMSPGYCDWGLEGQKVLFRAIDPGAVGIRLTDRWLMVPRKSISAACLLARTVPIIVQCVTCARTDCPFRRADHDPEAGKMLRDAMEHRGGKAK